MRFARTLILTLVAMASTPGVAGGTSMKSPAKPLAAISGDAKFDGNYSADDVTVVQFWASWCVGCAEVMAEMSGILQTRKDIGFVSISLDETKELAVKYFANKSDIVKATMPRAFLDPSGALFSEANSVDSLPYLIFVKKDGTVLRRVAGHPKKSDMDFLLGKGGK